MKIVEDVPTVTPKHRTSLTRKWRIVTGVLLIAVIVFASMATIQSGALNQATSERDTLQTKYNQLLAWTSTTDDAITFLKDVVQLDLSKYQATLVSRTIDSRSDLGGVTEESMHYALSGTDSTGSISKLTVSFRFRNGQFSRYQLSVDEGSPIYANPQSPFVLDAAKNIIERLQTYESAAYLGNISQLMSLVSTANSMEIKEGNVKLNATVSGDSAEVLAQYTENGVDFSPKSLDIVYDKGVLKSLTDGWSLFSIGSTQVSVSSDRAVALAKSALSGFQWAANGAVVSSFQYNPEPASVVFHPMTKEGLALYPQWTVTFYLDKVYAGGAYMISVSIWADTGEIAGKPQPQNSPQTFSI